MNTDILIKGYQMKNFFNLPCAVFVNLFVFVLTLSCHLLKDNTTQIKKDYLYILWVEKTIEDNKKLSLEEISQRNKESKTLIEKALTIKKKKQFSEAIQLLESAIDKYINAEVYYEYANVLSSARRFQDAIKAYEISLKLEYKRPELVLYNIACSYSLLNDEENTYKYLEKAIQKGYKAFEYMEKDPDLKNVREKNEWKWNERINAYKLPDIELKEENVTGFIYEGNSRPASFYFLCKNGIALRNDFYDDSCGNGYDKGTWRIFDKQIQFSWVESCKPLGVKENPYYKSMGGCKFSKYQFLPCKNKADSMPQKQMTLFSKFEYYQVKEMLSVDKGEPLWREQTKTEPPHCNPDFIPKTLEDLDSQRHFRLDRRN
jgi:tetratricopeptide (TPR) repeat protein